MPRPFFIMQEYLTTQEAAKYLRIAVKTLERWRAKKISPPYKKINGKILYSAQDLQNWMEGH